MRMTINQAVAATTAAALIIILAGCSTARGTDLVPTAPKQATEAAVTAPTAIPGDTDGNGRLSEFEKQVLAQNAVRKYMMPDGTTVAIDPTQPLPASVTASIADQAAPILATFTSPDINTSGPAIESLRALANDQAAATGRGIVLMFSAPSAIVGQPGASEMIWHNIASGVKSTGVMGETDRDASVTKVHAWCAGKPYDLVVIE